MNKLRRTLHNFREWLHHTLGGDNLTVQRLGLLLLIGSLLSAVVGYFVTHPEGFTLATFITDFYANLSTEFFSIAITVLIIDALNRRREERLEEEREQDTLIRQLGSRVHDTAIVAAEMLRKRGWMEDGTLQERDLRGADLEEAKLWKADLQGADFQWAKLKSANLNGAMLMGTRFYQTNLQTAKLNGVDARGANFHEAKLYRAALSNSNLQEADLSGAHLEGAKLHNVNLRGANLSRAYFDELTILPDNQPWTPETDLARFTNPEHANFFVPEMRAEGYTHTPHPEM